MVRSHPRLPHKEESMIETQPLTLRNLLMLRNLLDFDFAPTFQRFMEAINIAGYIVIACALFAICYFLAVWWWNRV